MNRSAFEGKTMGQQLGAYKAALISQGLHIKRTGAADPGLASVLESMIRAADFTGRDVEDFKTAVDDSIALAEEFAGGSIVPS